MAEIILYEVEFRYKCPVCGETKVFTAGQVNVKNIEKWIMWSIDSHHKYCSSSFNKTERRKDGKDCGKK